MSGPKVVRIVTREEVLAICEGHLRRLDQAIVAWAAAGQRIGELSAEEIAATRERQRGLAALIATDAFSELQKKVTDEIAFLKDDMIRRQAIAIDKAEQLVKRRRQGRDSATTLLAALKSKGVEPPQDLVSKLALVASGAEVLDADVLLARGFGLLVPETSREISMAQMELAGRLLGGERTQDFGEWKVANMSRMHNPLINRVDRQIAEAQVLLDESGVATFAEKLRLIERDVNESRRNLLLDSLILDLASAVKTSRTHNAAIEELHELASEMSAEASAGAKALVGKIRECGPATTLNEIRRLAAECRELIAREQDRKAAQARRDVILNGLARLGYEVNEGMQTAWARDGRVVVKNPSVPDYGVELGGHTQTGRLQVRAVALTKNHDTSRDQDVETLWCGDFGKLQELLVTKGDTLLVERAIGVGEVPLKMIGDGNAEVTATDKGRVF
ncbi:hypothetical protein [Pandoraea sp. ISTKB]|uniref:hypothetical protein n=1 Tax=Pandoraea sp. ISTKB TaxID=1586708 RepID=UPI000847D16A|nr:hypothetical protein [Pandoraea sp. ISTKB]ODP32115.1 hypothetical protein A9762_05180 [Pandoraea sp. ISTKB]